MVPRLAIRRTAPGGRARVARPFAIAVLACAALASASCGSRLSNTELAAAASGGGTATQAAGRGTTSGDQNATTQGDQSPLADTGAGTTGGSGPTGAPATSGSGVSANATPASPAAQGTGADSAAEPIVIGSLGDWTGIAEGSTLPGQKAILAWFQAINARGGIAGHKVQLIAEDTGGDPARAQAVAKDLVETRHVIAVVDASQPFTFDNTRPYFETRNIPVVGTDLTLMSEWASPVVFPQGATSITLNSGVVKTATEQGKKKIGIIYCAESAACQANVGQINDAAAKYGATVVYSGQASLGAPDFTAQCIQAQQRGADAVIVYLDVNGYSRVMTSCGRQNYHPLWMAQAGSTGDILGQNPNSDGLIVASPVFPWTLGSPQEFSDFQAAMKKYASGTALTASMSQAWAAGELFRAAAEKAIATGGGHLTRDGLFNALWGMQGETAFGTAPALGFTKGRLPTQPSCYFPLVLHNGKMSAPAGANSTCL